MIIAGCIFLGVALLVLFSSFSYGGFIGNSFDGFLIILGIGVSLLIAGVVKKRNKK